MELNRRSVVVYVLLASVWALVVAWQAEEHFRVREAAKADLSNRSKDIANTVSACIRGMRFRSAVLEERLQPVLNELVNGRTNELVKSSELISIALLNAAGKRVASAGRPIDPDQIGILQQGERWGQKTVTFVNPVDLGSSLGPEGLTNPTVVLPRLSEFTNNFPDSRRNRSASRHEPPPDGPPPNEPPLRPPEIISTNQAGEFVTNTVEPADRERGRPR